MKTTNKLVLTLATLGLISIATLLARADASQSGCFHSHDRAAGCTKDDDDHDKKSDPVSMPEPGTFVQLASGLLALGGLAAVVRRRRDGTA